MSQTAYPLVAPLAFAGMIGEGGGRENSISRNLEDAIAIPAGVMGVAPASDPEDEFRLPSAAGQTQYGITVHRHGREDFRVAGTAAFIQGEDVELLRRGRIWVVVEETVVANDPVFFRHTVNGGLIPGGWRNDAAAAEADAVLNAIFVTGAAIGTVALIDINLP